MNNTRTALIDRELLAELLKERIYATLALLAVLVSIDTKHYSIKHSAVLVFGTIISLWLASLVSTKLARRVVFQNDLDHANERQEQLRKHGPMLSALVFPGFMLLLASVHIVSLGTAINISIASALLLLVGWSVMSARSLKAGRASTLLLAAAEVGIGLAVVSLKVFLGH